MSKKRILIEESGKTQIKKFQLDKKMLIKNTLKANTNSDIANQEIENFLKIFSVVINQIKNEGKSNNKVTYAEDGIKDMLLTIGEEIYKLLQQDIDLFNLPEIIKKALKTLQETAAFVLAKKKPWPELQQHQRPIGRLQRPIGGVGVKNTENIRRRDKDIKKKS